VLCVVCWCVRRRGVMTMTVSAAWKRVCVCSHDEAARWPLRVGLGIFWGATIANIGRLRLRCVLCRRVQHLLSVPGGGGAARDLHPGRAEQSAAVSLLTQAVRSSIFRDKNRRRIGKSQSRRPPKSTQRRAHLRVPDMRAGPDTERVPAAAAAAAGAGTLHGFDRRAPPAASLDRLSLPHVALWAGRDAHAACSPQRSTPTRPGPRI
jgi:hypothetical protein